MNKKKHLSLILAIAFIINISWAPSVSALSCVYPDAEYANTRISDTEDNLIFVGQVVNSNKIENFDGVKIEISDVVKGYTVPKETWAYYVIDETWGYLCAGAPIAIGNEAVFDVWVENGIYYVSQAHELNSDSAAKDVFLNNIQPNFEYIDDQNWKEELKRYGQELWIKLRLLVNTILN